MKVKVIQLNILNGGKFLGRIIDFLKKENPDILLCQEVQKQQDPKLPIEYRTIPVLPEALNFKYFYFSPCSIRISPVGKIPWGNAIFSKFPITKSQTYFYFGKLKESMHRVPDDSLSLPRNLQQITVDAKGKTVNIFNNHGFWGFDGNDNNKRLMMADFILEKINDYENIILGGDFNVNENTKTIAKIQEVLNDPFKGERKTSFNMKQKDRPGYAKAVADFIFTSPNIKVLEHHQPDVDISDHLPLIVTLEI